MAYGRAIICRFDTVSDLRGKDRTYTNIKAAVLEAGKFSCFDVETNSDGRLFTQLCRDPEIETFDMGYPWTGVRRRTPRALDAATPCAHRFHAEDDNDFICIDCGARTPRQ